MGFWHTGYMEFHEPSGYSGETKLFYPPKPQEFPCEVCSEIFETIEKLNEHRFRGHEAQRSRLFFRGTECGRSRIPILSRSEPIDWVFDGVSRIYLNDEEVDEASAKSKLCEANGLVRLELLGEQTIQKFDLLFDIANAEDLVAVECALEQMVLGRKLTFGSIQGFLDGCKPLESSSSYSDGLANYFYGVLAREHSPESSIWRGQDGEVAYRARFDDAVHRLGSLDRGPAAAVSALVAFHYNQFEIAMKRTKDSFLADVAKRLSLLLDGRGTAIDLKVSSAVKFGGYEQVFVDNKTEQTLTWCSIDLDGSAQKTADEIEALLPSTDLLDRPKLHLILAEHYFACASYDATLRHADEVWNTPITAKWQSDVRRRVKERWR